MALSPCHSRQTQADPTSRTVLEPSSMSFAAAIALRSARRGSQHARQLSTLTLPDLPYDYNALEPVISAEIMELHHKKHHQTYVNTFNTLSEQLSDAEAKTDIAKMIALQAGIKFNGGGHVNHSIFWKNLTPPKDFVPPSGELAKAIEAEFGSVDSMIAKFNPKTAAVQGSGWGWLGYNAETGRLQIATTANQDPLVTQGLTPLLGVDVWEHAYYLQYKNVRPDYLKNIWKVVNWKDAGQRYDAAKSA